MELNSVPFFAFAVLGGFALLIWGADRFVAGAAGAARNLGVSPLIIGLTIVGFGTSAPEVLVSAVAAWRGNPGLAMGNALGSNITNIALVLGFTATIKPLTVHSRLIRREFPILLGIMAGAFLLAVDGNLDRCDGAVLLLGLGGLIYWMVHQGKQSRVCPPEQGDGACDPLGAEYAEEIPAEMSMAGAILRLGGGFLVLLVSSRILVWGAVGLARSAGLSDLVIGLTVVAFGTSLPELAASVVSAVRNQHDIAVGNVVGSNMYNLLAVFALPGLIRPGACEREMLLRDFPVMVAVTLMLIGMAVGGKGPRTISRIQGVILCTVFFGYCVVLYIMSAPS